MFLSFLNSISFFARIEQMRSLSLRGRPVGVAVPSSVRSPLLSVSIEAEKEGVLRGMPLKEALEICPEVKIIPPNFPLYRKLSEEIVKIALHFSPSVEISGPGHSFVDLKGTTRLWGLPEDGVRKIQREVKKRINITTSAGLSSYRFISATASHLCPEGEIMKIEEGKEFHFLKEVPVYVLPGIEYPDFKLLNSLNISTTGELLFLERTHLIAIMGKRGEKLYKNLHLLFNPPVSRCFHKEEKITSSACIFPETNSSPTLRTYIMRISANLALQLEKIKRYTGLLSLSLFYTDGTKEKQATKVYPPSKNEKIIYSSLRSALLRRKRRKKVRKIEVLAKKLTPFYQTSLFLQREREKLQKIDSAIKYLRKKYGKGVIKYGDSLTNS